MPPGGGGVEGDEVEFVRGAGVKWSSTGTPAGARTAPGSGSSGDHVYSHPAWPGQRQGLAGLLAGYPVTSSAR